LTKLVIGVLAHNEAKVVGNLLSDLSQQSVFQADFKGLEVEICVVPNGCKDRTADISRSILESLDFPDHVIWKVEEIEQAGKTNAWNVFVHDLAPEDADYLLFLDADISLPQTDIIERSIATLEAHPDAWIASDESRDVFPEDAGLSFMKIVSPMVAGTAGGQGPSICGQFYCARAARLRQITLPVGLLSQDGFIRAMVLTSGLTEPEQLARIRSVPGAYHLHPAYTKLSSRFRYEKRQAMSTTVYTYVYDILNTLPPTFEERMKEIKRLNKDDPDWLARVVQKECSKTSFPVPRRYVLKRMKNLRGDFISSARKTPVILPALAFDIFVGWRASRELKKNALGGAAQNANRFTVRQNP